MKRFFAILLTVILCLGVCACGPAAPEPTPTPAESAEPTPTPEPVGIQRWERDLLRRYNMDYADFGEYWSLLCDSYFGDAPQKLLSIVTFPDKETEIKERRSEFTSKYGKDAHYKILSATETELGKKYRKDFAAELEGLYKKARLFLDECEGWDDTAWRSFATAQSCTLEQAREIGAAYAEIAEACCDKSVEKAVTVELVLRFSNGTKRTESMNLYVIDGYYVSEQLIDSADMLLNLVYN